MSLQYVGGQHPAFKGEVLAARYVVLGKEGWGARNRKNEWIARDCKEDMLVIVRISESAPRMTEMAWEEVEIGVEVGKGLGKGDKGDKWRKELQELYRDWRGKEENFCEVVLNAFVHFGPMGNHFCIVTELLGPSLEQILQEADLGSLDLSIIKKIQRQVLLGTHYLHEYCGIVHTDIKASNLFLHLPYIVMKRLYEEMLATSYEEEQLAIEEHKKKMSLKKAVSELKTQQESKKLSKKERKKLLQKIKKKEQKIKEVALGEEISQNTSTAQQEDSTPGRSRKTDQGGSDPKKFGQERGHKSMELSVVLGEKKSANQNGRPSSKGLKRTESHGSSFENYKPEIVDTRELKNRRLIRLLYEGEFSFKFSNFSNAVWEKDLKAAGYKLTTRPGRAPELILERTITNKIELWSIGCLFYKLFTLEDLFKPRESDSKLYSRDDDHLAQIIELLGPFPLETIFASPKRRHFFDKEGKLRRINALAYVPLKELLQDRFRVKPSIASEFAAFLSNLLQVEPSKRPTPRQLLESDWLTKKSQDECVFLSELEWTEEAFNQACNTEERELFYFHPQLQPELHYYADTEDFKDCSLDSEPTSCNEGVLDRDYCNPDYYLAYDEGIRIEELDRDEDILYRVLPAEDDILNFVLSES